jgi:anti-sigma regulatory factor (Ser/Thr protein kinase)
MAGESMSYDHTITDSFQLRFEPTYAAASRARQDVRPWLDASGVPAPTAADLELVVSELTANAVAQQPPGPVSLEVVVSGGAVRVTVANQRTGNQRLSGPRGADSEPDVLADQGRGLSIVGALTDEVTIEVTGGWTSVTCVRRLQPADG